MPEDQAKRLVGHTYVLAFDLGNGRSIQVNGNLYADDDQATINGKFDAMMAVLERQRARAEVEIIEAELKQRVKRVEEIDLHIAQTKAQISAMATKVRKAPGDDNALKQLEAALANHVLNRKRMEIEVAEGETNVGLVKQKAA